MDENGIFIYDSRAKISVLNIAYDSVYIGQPSVLEMRSFLKLKGR